jgi:ribose 5-phosphate isomerase RpiB
MNGNGRLPANDQDGAVLRWSGRVLSADDVRRRVNGHRLLLLPHSVIVTPLAAEELRDHGVEWEREVEKAKPSQLGYAQDRGYPLVASALRTLERDGLLLRDLGGGDGPPCRWAKALAECVGRGDCLGGVVFCADPGLVCCVANKLPGLRAAAVLTVGQAARATLTLGVNLLAVEMPGRTFFEVRQILRTLCDAAGTCPDGVACTLRELDGHAHR